MTRAWPTEPRTPIDSSAARAKAVGRRARWRQTFADADPRTEFIQGWPFWRPLCALMLLTLVFRGSDLDLRIARWCFDAETGTWPWERVSPWREIYRLGIFPGFLIGGLGGLCGVLGWRWRLSMRTRRAGLFLLCGLVVGPGLLVNVGMKHGWSRPRPHEVEEFGGSQHFLRVGTPALNDSSNASFPSGHAAIAFYAIAPAFVVGGGQLRLCRGLLAFGLGLGTVMSIARVLQGGHWVSDVVWSAGAVYLTTVGLSAVLLSPVWKRVPPPTANRQRVRVPTESTTS